MTDIATLETPFEGEELGSKPSYSQHFCVFWLAGHLSARISPTRLTNRHGQYLRTASPMPLCPRAGNPVTLQGQKQHAPIPTIHFFKIQDT
ncbi:unnamed protein product [Menidia menidia]|uniref:(Atlantic silverside) hypothetical protein n=1 Tax=Menidia menidia TaxID=238744 RepID=A0A8S4BI70_9TELE|nr:unnamed protein product [Menidia menidia]